MKKTVVRWGCLVLMLLVAGCSKKQPEDTSGTQSVTDSATSEMKKAQHEIKRLRSVFEEETASSVDLLSEKEKIPQQVYTLSFTAREFLSFKWAIDNGAKPVLKTKDLVAIWAMGEEWRKLILAKYPETLPVFMSEAFNQFDVHFFDAHIEALNTNKTLIAEFFDVREFNTRRCCFIGSLMTIAVSDKNQERIFFLVEQMPPFRLVGKLDTRTESAVRKLGAYVFGELKDEALAIKLVQLGYDYGPLDLEQTGFSPAFNQALLENPACTVQLLGLHHSGPPLTSSDMKLLMKLPIEKLTNLHPQHVDEAIQLCMERGVEMGTKQFIQLRFVQRPPQKADYNELMNWALRYNDATTYGILKMKGGDLAPEDIDLSALASNQTMFEKHVTRRMDKINYTFDESNKEGITLAEIYRIFENKNQKAGLFVVKEYNLGEEWFSATQDRTLFMDVCRAGNLAAAKYLIERRNADISATTRYTDQAVTVYGSSTPSEGRLSAIFFAAQSGNSDLIKYLKSKGANINARSNFGATPLMHAVSKGQLEAVKTLIESGADVNVKMDETVRNYVREERYSYAQLATALLRAKATGNAEIIDVLIKAGANR